MRAFVAALLGLFSGVLIYMAAALLISGGGSPSGGFVAVTFLGGWALSAWLLARGARSISKVFGRGFLLGAAEWFCMIPIGIVAGGRAAASTAASSPDGAGKAGAAIGGGLVSVLTGGVSFAMAIVCMLGFAISYFIGREMKAESATPTKTCPECAELIQVAARKCKHCGAVLAS